MFEKIIKLEDGSRAKITCSLASIRSKKKFEYQIGCTIAAPRKRIFTSVVDEDDYKYRGLSLEERRKFRAKAILAKIGIGECEAIAYEFWESLKPHNIEINVD